MRTSTLTSNWKAGVAALRHVAEGEYLPIEAILDGSCYEVVRFSRYKSEYDEHKLEDYLLVSSKDFSARASFFVNHVSNTGIGIILTFRAKPSYVIDPGANWRLFAAAQFGVSRARYAKAAGKSRFIERLIEGSIQGERIKRLSAERRLMAAQDEAADLRIELAVVEQEVNHLRREASLRPQD